MTTYYSTDGQAEYSAQPGNRVGLPEYEIVVRGDGSFATVEIGKGEEIAERLALGDMSDSQLDWTD